MPTTQATYRVAIRAALAGLWINLGLGVVKLIAGLIGNAYALIADSVNSLGDVFTSLVVLFALYVARRPADKEHPYGHTRAEAIAGSNVALLVMVSAVIIAWQAIVRWHTVHDLPPTWTLWIAAGNAVIKEGLYRYKLRIGTQTRSSALIANAWDHRSDALCALAVLVGLGIVRWGGRPWLWADEAAALVVACAIIWSAARVFRASAHELLDSQAERGLVTEIERHARTVEGVRDIETLLVRKSGIEYFVDIHIEVDPDLTVRRGHEIGHAVKDAVMARMHLVRDVLVHLEPYEGGTNKSAQ